MTRFLQDPDQVSRRRELTAFIGPNASGYLKTYDAMRASATRTPGEKPVARLNFGFNPLAFFLGPSWFFYRRMWFWAWAIVAGELALGVVTNMMSIRLPAGLGIGLAAGIAAAARYAYVPYAINRIVALRGDRPVADDEGLRAAGGVSPIAGWISGGILVAFGVLVIAAAVIAGPQVQGVGPR